MIKKYWVPVLIIVILLTGCQPAGIVKTATVPVLAATTTPLSPLLPATATSAPSPMILPDARASTTTTTVTPTETQAQVTPRWIGPTPTAIKVTMATGECIGSPPLHGDEVAVRAVGSTQCLLWADEFNNENGFRVVLQFGYNGDMFVYETPANRPGMPYPAVLAAPLGQSFEYCMTHKDYTLDIYALLPDQAPNLITGFSPALECDRFGMPSATPQPFDESNSTTLVLSATPMPSPSPTAIYENSFAVGFSTDGSRLAFNSSLDGLVPEDHNHKEDAFLYSPLHGTIERVSITPDDASFIIPSVSLSANGRYLLFAPRDAVTNYADLRDLETGHMERLDFTALRQELGAPILEGHLSPHGRYLALRAAPGNWRLLLYDHTTGKTNDFSKLPDGSLADGDFFEPTFSPEGNYLAFASTASNLVSGDTPCSEANPACGDVFVYDLIKHTLERIPANLSFTLGNPYPYLAVSNDARWLSWTELDRTVSSFHPVIRLYDRSTRKTETVCAGESACTGHVSALSADGRWLAFGTIPGMTKAETWEPAVPAQVYLRDNQTGKLTLVSADPTGRPGDANSGIVLLQQEGFSGNLVISGDGHYVAFASQAANLLPAGSQKRQCYSPAIVGQYACYDLFVFDRQTGKLNGVLP